jgi:hypothetical protein
MKKLFILLAFFIGLNAFAQSKKFEGVWMEENTESIRVINLSNKDSVSIRNIHLDLDYDFYQEILEYNETTIKTRSYYSDNNWTVYVTYTIDVDGALIASYSGDYTGTTKHKKVY